METKQIATIKELKSTAEGVITGRASVYGVVDHGGDVVMPGAFRETLKTKQSVPFLVQHDPSAVVGKAVLDDRPDGLHFVATLALDLPEAKDLHTRIKHGLIDGISIGYLVNPGGAKFNKQGVRELHSVELVEISAVTFPMNTEARVTGVKAGQHAEIAAVLAALEGSIARWKSETDIADTVAVLFALAEANEKITRIHTAIADAQ